MVLVGGLSFVSMVWSYFVPGELQVAEQHGVVLRGEPAFPVQGRASALAAESVAQSQTKAGFEVISTGAFDEQAIRDALQYISLDRNGKLRVEPRGLDALYAAIGFDTQRFDPAQLAQLQRLLAQGLPAAAAQQTLLLVQNYNRYLHDKQVLEDQYGELSLPQELERKLRDLDALRNQYFGEVDANHLFARQRRHEKYLLNDMMLSQDEGLTEEEKQFRRDSMEQMLLSEDPDIHNWRERYASFLQEKQRIIEASIPESDKAEQINALYFERFSEEERLEIAQLDLLD